MEFADPIKNISKLNLRSGETVVDLGSGPGFYTIPAARIVGEMGKVFAVDILKEMLSMLMHTAEREGLKNIEPVWGDVDTANGISIKDSSADSIIVANTLFQVEKKENLVSEVKRILKQNGRVLLIDWAGSFGGLGPTEESVISKEDAIRIFNEGGFLVTEEFDAGDHHWGLIFKKG